MGTVDDSAHDKLDNMLHEGTISEDDYRNLSKALAASPDPPRATQTATSAVGLRKSWGERQLGGVCAGLAQYFDVETRIVRVAAVVLCLFVSPAAVPVYLIAYFMLPWDDAEAAKDTGARADALRLALWGVTFLTLVPMAFTLLLRPAVMAIYRDYGGPVPQVTRYVFKLADEYTSGFAYGLVSWGVLGSLAVVGLAALCCCAIRNDVLRRAYRVAFNLVAVGWTLFFCVGGCLGLLRLVTGIK